MQVPLGCRPSSVSSAVRIWRFLFGYHRRAPPPWPREGRPEPVPNRRASLGPTHQMIYLLTRGMGQFHEGFALMEAFVASGDVETLKQGFTRMQQTEK